MGPIVELELGCPKLLHDENAANFFQNDQKKLQTKRKNSATPFSFYFYFVPFLFLIFIAFN